LRFDSRRPNPKYLSLVQLLQERLAEALVIARPTRVAVPEVAMFGRTHGVARPGVAAA
jgi:hypothetical protein